MRSIPLYKYVGKYRSYNGTEKDLPVKTGPLLISLFSHFCKLLRSRSLPSNRWSHGRR